MTTQQAIPRIISLKVQNYRALRNLELKNLTHLTVFIGPNGSGKSTIFDVFAFLAECFNDGLRRALDRRGRFRELRSRGATGEIVFEIQYREKSDSPLITYHLAIDEDHKGNVFVSNEFLRWKRGSYGQPFNFLEFSNGQGRVISGELPDKDDQRVDERLSSPDLLAVNTLGQFAKHPRVSALRDFIAGWYLSYLSADSTRVLPEAGPQARVSKTGDNLPNVIQHLQEQYPQRLDDILDSLRKRVPRLERIDAETTIDGRLVLRIKDAPFETPIMARFASDGTLKMLAYLTMLYDPNPPPLIGIEEPENQLHPHLLRGLAEECMSVGARSQLLVTTHSPFFINALEPKQVWVLYRDEAGYTQAKKTADMLDIQVMVNDGALLGDLWMEKQFEFGYPLNNAGALLLAKG
jgi:predicted ATPase